MHSMVPEAVVLAARAAHDLLRSMAIPHVFVGGLAVGVYGWERMTRDVDILVGSRTDLDRIARETGATPLEVIDGVTFELNRVDIDVFRPPAHRKALAAAIQAPRWVDGLPIISLPGLVLLKIHEHARSKDLADVVEILKAQGPTVAAEVRAAIAPGLARGGDTLADYDLAVLTAEAERSGRRPVRANSVLRRRAGAR